MTRSRIGKGFLAVVGAITLLGAAVISDYADARGSGFRSFGSRGSQTFSRPPATQTAPNAARPIERSVTQPGQTSPGMAAQRPAAGPAAAPSMGRSLMTGIGAGLLGAGLFGLLAGTGFFAGLGSLAGFLGFLLQIALIVGVVMLVMRFVRGRQQPAPVPPVNLSRAGLGGGGSDAPPRGAGPGVGPGAGPAARSPLAGFGSRAQEQPAVRPMQLEGSDFESFERLLGEIQMAYGREDIATIRALSTPEVASYFEQDIAENERKGVVDRFDNIKLLQGDLSEAWAEPDADYATVAMRYAVSEATVDRNTGRAVEGDLSVVDEVTEIWTFRRERQSGEDWKLSAIQQVEPALA